MFALRICVDFLSVSLKGTLDRLKYKTLVFFVSLQEKDLKQYMDDCGSIMSVHNVKVMRNNPSGLSAIRVNISCTVSFF